MASFSGSSTRPTELPENPGLATFFQQDAAVTEQAPSAPQSGSLDGFFRQDANPNRSGKPGAGNTAPARNATPISPATMDAIALQEGLSPTQKRVMGALLGQESGYGQHAATSIDGARGAGQIMPGTFRHFAKLGEVIDNPAHNLAVMARIVKALGAQAGDDPAKMAVGYFSGSGNINPGSGPAWRNDRLDGNGKSVSSYTADVLARLGTSPTESTPITTPDKAADPLANAPKWTTVIAKPEYQAMSDSDKAGARQAYFAAFIEPGIAPEQKDRYRTWFEAEAAKAEEVLKPSMLERIKTGAQGLIDSSRKLLQPDNPNASVMDGMPVSDPFAGDQHDAGKVGMRQATLNRRATEAQLAAMRQQIAHPPSFASAIDAPVNLASMVGNAKDNLRAAEFGVGKGFATLGKYLALLTAVPSIARDSMVGDEQARTIMFDNVVKPFDEAMRYYEHGNDALPQSVGIKVSNALGDLAATMPAIIATGGGVNPETKYMVDIAKYAFAQGMNREAAMILVRGSADTLGNAMVTMSPAAIPGAFERYQKLTDSGIDPVTASKAAFAEYATTTAMGALPLWKSGGIATRMTTGAAGGMGIAAGSTALQNQVLSNYPGQQQDPFDRDNLIVGGVTGSALAGLMGHPKPGKVTVTRTDQQNLPPRVEPDFSGTTIDGETGRPVGEPDWHAPRLGERIEPTRDEAPSTAGQPEPATASDAPTTEPVKSDAPVTPAKRAKPAKATPAEQPQLLPATEAEPITQRVFTDQEILGYADTRYRQLRTAQEGETVETIDEDGQILEVSKPGAALTSGEAAELAALRQHRGNAQELARLYGFNQAAPSAEPAGPVVPEIVNPLPALAPPDSAPTDLHEQRDNAITVYRQAAESGNEAASLAAEQQLAITREQINAGQVQASKDLQAQLSAAASAAASAAETKAETNAETAPAPDAVKAAVPRTKTEKEARARRDAAKAKQAEADRLATDAAIPMKPEAAPSEAAPSDAAQPDAAHPVAMPRTEKQANAFHAKQIPDMTDEDLAQAKAFYPAEHKRTPKIAREIARRALAAKESAKTQPAAPMAATSGPEAIETPAPVVHADSLKPGETVAFLDHVANVFHPGDQAVVVGQNKNATLFSRADGGSAWIDHARMNRQQPGAWHVITPAAPKADLSRPELLRELKNRLSNAGVRALAVHEGKLAGQMMGFTVGMSPNDKLLTREWVDRVAGGFESSVQHLEKRAAKQAEKQAEKAEPGADQPVPAAATDSVDTPVSVANAATSAAEKATTPATSEAKPAQAPSKPVQALEPEPVKAKPEPEPGTGTPEPVPATLHDTGPQAERGPSPASVAVKPRNFTITDELNFSGQGAKTLFKNNVAAIELLKALDAEQRQATPAEQSVLARYIGWGGMPQVFNPKDAKWKAEFEQLQTLLTPEEYATAASSTRNAHYTAAPVVTSMWQAVQRMGFTHGAVLEPSLGSGNFFGLMPLASRSKSQLLGVEFDHITGSLAKHLYPQASIHAPLGFQDVSLVSDSFDLAIGNPPFGAESLYDKAHADISRFKIHGFFFAKSVKALRPGGVLAMVVSKGLLDANDGQGRAAREWLTQHTRLLGAIRLPNSAFQENANTEVTTDIVFLQKLASGIAPNSDEWGGLSELSDRESGQAIAVNQYFVAHPEMMLGEMTLAGSMYRANEPTLSARPGDDLAQLLAQAVQALPVDVIKMGSGGIMAARTAPSQSGKGKKTKTSADQAADAERGQMPAPDVRPYGHFMQTGKLYQRMPDANGERMTVAVPLAGRELERMKGMIQLRDVLREQLRLEKDAASSDKAVAANRRALNKAYDAFKAKQGLLHAQANKRLFHEDSDASLLLSLEAKYDKGVSEAVARTSGQKPREARAEKAAIFSGRVQTPLATVTKVASAKEAMIASLNELGEISPVFIEKVYGKSMQDTARELGDLAFEDPLTGWQPRDLYLSGNVKESLQVARVAAQKDTRYERNVAALLAVQPPDINPSDIFVKIGSPWVAASDYHDFVQAMFGGTLSGTFIPSIGRWSVMVAPGTATETTSKYGTNRLGAHSIMEALMGNKQVAVYDHVSDGKGGTRAVLNVDATAAAQGKADELAESFQDWIWHDNARRERLSREYNDKFNTNVTRKYDGSHLSLPGMNPAVELRPHQLNWVFRSLIDGVGLSDHVVGAGKTYALIASAMEMRRLGLAKKPMVTVPNHLVGQWAADILTLYPGANVLAASRKDFVKEKRKLMFSKIATGDWDLVVVAHSSFGRIPVPMETEQAILQEQMKEIVDAIVMAKKDKGTKFTVKDLERTKVRVEERIKMLADRPQDDLLDFADLGVDALLVDEAHEFKNLFFSTALQGVAGLGSPTGSSRAFDMFVKTRYVLGRTGGRNVFFATGTPVANSIAEVFHMQRFLQNDTLRARGIHQFDAWANTFGQATSDWEMNAAGKFVQKNRFRKFANLPELKGMWHEVADTVTRPDLIADAQKQGKRFPLPKVATGRAQNVVTERSDLQAAFIGIPFPKLDKNGQPMVDETTGQPLMEFAPGTIVYRLENWKEAVKRNPKEIPLAITGAARKAGLDYRLIDDQAPDFAGSKVNAAVERLVSIWQANDYRAGTQLVFCDLSVPAKYKGKATAEAAEKGPTFFVKDGEAIEHVAGVAVKLASAPDLGFFSFTKRKLVHIHERTSGQLVASASTKQAAIDQANGRIASIGQAKLMERVSNHTIDPELIEDYLARWEEANQAKEKASDSEGQGEGAAKEISLDELLADDGNAFSVYDDIRTKLIAHGMPPEQIAFIHDYATDEKKAALFAAMNAGSVRVLLGSTQKMGAGTNVQAKLVALHHLDAPWRPADLEQREGRIIRQKNSFYEADPDGFEVQIFRYATKQTYDSRMWEIIETKARAIEQFKLDASLREIDDVSSESANAAEMKAGASGNPLILTEIGLRTDLRKLDAQKKSWEKSRFDLEKKIDQAAHKNGWVYQRNEYYLRLAKHIQGKDGAVLILDGKPVPKPKDLDATKVFTTLMEAGAQNGGRGTVVAHYRGFDVVSALDGAGRSLNLAVSFEGEAAARTGYTLEDKFSVVGLMTRLDNMVDGLSNAIKAGADSVTAFEADAGLAKLELKRGFPKATELERVKTEHKAVVAALRAGKTAIDPPEVELNDIANLLESGPLARQEDHKRVATLAKLKSLQQRLEAGKLTPQEFQLGIAQLVNRIQARNDAKVPQARERGSEWIAERLMRAKRLQELSAPAVDFALWALQQNPAMADDLAISLKQRSANVAGSYSPFNRLMTLFKGSSNRHTVVHEILHHTERMMPPAVQQAIVNAWQRAWSQAWQASSGPVRAALQDMMLASSGDKSALQRVSKAFKDKVLSYDAHYPLVNASEYWAVNASTLLGKRYAAKDAWIAQARQWLSELLERVKGWLHLDSQAPVLKGLAAVLKGNGQRFSPTMLHKLAQDAADNATDLHDLWSQYRQTKAQQQALIDEFGKPAYSNMDWWDKSIGTQFHKAQKHPHFRKAFNLAVERENAISLTAIRPAELAPAFLPRVDDFKSAVKTLIKGRDTSVQMSLAGDALLSGTLFGPTVLHGKVWSTAELQSQFGMDSQGIMLYQQARAAIDASLDEVAAAEGFAALQMQVPSGLREKVIVDPAKAFDVLKDAIDLQISLITMHLQNLPVTPANLDEIAKTQAKLHNAMQARTTLEAIYTHVANLKKAGYAPLMRFGKNFVSVEEIDPVTGCVAIDKATGKPIVLYFGRYETNGEAEADYYRQQVNFRGVPDVVVKSGPINDERHRLYQGVSAETIALFGQVVGDNTAMNHFYQAVLSERSALKRRLERKSIAGFSHDMPRILANSITSNGRLAAQRYYTRDLMMAIKRIPREKGDIQKEAQRLKEFLDNPQDAGAMASSLAFSWFLGGNIASAAVNATQPVMMTLPYLSQWGAAKAAKAASAAALPAMGKQQITNPQLRIDLKRASQEGKVDSQEIFHLYSVGIQGVAAALTNKLGKVPLLGSKVKMASEDARARLMAFSTLWGMPFAMVEGFNRRLTFIAAWNMANEANMRDPYAFAVKAVDATQGIYNKVNRPNWARSSVGRTVFTFTQFRIMNVELLKRMATMGGAEGKKGAAMYLAILILAAGVAGLPYADDIDDIIDTLGQWLGYGTNMKRNKREWAYTTLGKGFGDFALYGASAHLPLDFGGRLGLGNMMPGTGLGKISGEGNRTREFLELGGPTIGGLGQQLFDAYDAASIGDHGKAAKALMPSSIKNAAAGLDMAQTGKAYDMKGKEKADVTLVDAVSKGIGFNPSVIANKNRANLPIQQDIALQKVVESNIVELWAQGAAKGDQAMMERAKVRMETWNQKNPDMPVMISANQIMGKARQIMTPADARLLKNAPREMRGRVAAGLDMEP